MSTEELKLARQVIRTIMNGVGGPISPQELLQRADEDSVREDTASVVIWDLIDRGEIELTGDMKLKPPRKAA